MRRGFLFQVFCHVHNVRESVLARPKYWALEMGRQYDNPGFPDFYVPTAPLSMVIAFAMYSVLPTRNTLRSHPVQESSQQHLAPLHRTMGDIMNLS